MGKRAVGKGVLRGTPAAKKATKKQQAFAQVRLLPELKKLTRGRDYVTRVAVSVRLIGRDWPIELSPGGFWSSPCKGCSRAFLGKQQEAAFSRREGGRVGRTATGLAALNW